MQPPFVNRLDELSELYSIVNRGFYPVMYLYGPEGCGKTRLLRELLDKVRSSDEYVVVYIDAQSVRKVEEALWATRRELVEIIAELASDIAGPVGRALALAITAIARRVERKLVENRKMVIVVDDVAKPIGLDSVELYAKNLLALLEELYSIGASSVTVIATTSEGLSRKLVARHSYARLFELWNLSPSATQQLLEVLEAPRGLFDDIWALTGGNPRSVVELWRIGWDVEKWRRGIARNVSAIIDSLLPTYRRELEEVSIDIDALVSYPELRDRLLELNLVIPVDRPCIGYTPPVNKDLGIGKRYAWQLPVYREIIKELLPS